jgi:hypothetical protein
MQPTTICFSNASRTDSSGLPAPADAYPRNNKRAAAVVFILKDVEQENRCSLCQWLLREKTPRSLKRIKADLSCQPSDGAYVRT